MGRLSKVGRAMDASGSKIDLCEREWGQCASSAKMRLRNKVIAIDIASTDEKYGSKSKK